MRQTNQAPPVARALRILLGVVLIVYTMPAYFHVPMRIAVGASVIVLGLIGVYSLIHIVVFGPFLGAIVANMLLVALYFAGASGLPMLGRGKGQLAAVTFLGVCLVVAGVRAAPGCEVMAIPGVLFGKHTELACIIFSPLDRLERKLGSKRHV